MVKHSTSYMKKMNNKIVEVSKLDTFFMQKIKKKEGNIICQMQKKIIKVK